MPFSSVTPGVPAANLDLTSWLLHGGGGVLPLHLSWEGSPCSPLRGYSSLQPRDSTMVKAGPPALPRLLPTAQQLFCLQGAGQPLRAPGLLANGSGHRHSAQAQCHALRRTTQMWCQGISTMTAVLACTQTHPSQPQCLGTSSLSTRLRMGHL